MGSREVPFDPELNCDICQKKGAYDFMGDLLCPECMTKYIGTGEVKDGNNKDERWG